MDNKEAKTDPVKKDLNKNYTNDYINQTNCEQTVHRINENNANYMSRGNINNFTNSNNHLNHSTRNVNLIGMNRNLSGGYEGLYNQEINKGRENAVIHANTNGSMNNKVLGMNLRGSDPIYNNISPYNANKVMQNDNSMNMDLMRNIDARKMMLAANVPNLNSMNNTNMVNSMNNRNNMDSNANTMNNRNNINSTVNNINRATNVNRSNANFNYNNIDYNLMEKSNIGINNKLMEEKMEYTEERNSMRRNLSSNNMSMKNSTSSLNNMNIGTNRQMNMGINTSMNVGMGMNMNITEMNLKGHNSNNRSSGSNNIRGNTSNNVTMMNNPNGINNTTPGNTAQFLGSNLRSMNQFTRNEIKNADTNVGLMNNKLNFRKDEKEILSHEGKENAENIHQREQYMLNKNENDQIHHLAKHLKKNNNNLSNFNNIQFNNINTSKNIDPTFYDGSILNMMNSSNVSNIYNYNNRQPSNRISEKISDKPMNTNMLSDGYHHPVNINKSGHNSFNKGLGYSYGMNNANGSLSNRSNSISVSNSSSHAGSIQQVGRNINNSKGGNSIGNMHIVENFQDMKQTAYSKSNNVNDDKYYKEYERINEMNILNENKNVIFNNIRDQGNNNIIHDEKMMAIQKLNEIRNRQNTTNNKTTNISQENNNNNNNNAIKLNNNNSYNVAMKNNMTSHNSYTNFMDQNMIRKDFQNRNMQSKHNSDSTKEVNMLNYHKLEKSEKNNFQELNNFRSQLLEKPNTNMNSFYLNHNITYEEIKKKDYNTPYNNMKEKDLNRFHQSSLMNKSDKGATEPLHEMKTLSERINKNNIKSMENINKTNGQSENLLKFCENNNINANVINKLDEFELTEHMGQEKKRKKRREKKTGLTENHSKGIAENNIENNMQFDLNNNQYELFNNFQEKMPNNTYLSNSYKCSTNKKKNVLSTFHMNMHMDIKEHVGLNNYVEESEDIKKHRKAGNNMRAKNENADYLVNGNIMMNANSSMNTGKENSLKNTKKKNLHQQFDSIDLSNPMEIEKEKINAVEGTQRLMAMSKIFGNVMDDRDTSKKASINFMNNVDLEYYKNMPLDILLNNLNINKDILNLLKHKINAISRNVNVTLCSTSADQEINDIKQKETEKEKKQEKNEKEKEEKQTDAEKLVENTDEFINWCYNNLIPIKLQLVNVAFCVLIEVYILLLSYNYDKLDTLKKKHFPKFVAYEPVLKMLNNCVTLSQIYEISMLRFSNKHAKHIIHMNKLGKEALYKYLNVYGCLSIYILITTKMTIVEVDDSDKKFNFFHSFIASNFYQSLIRVVPLHWNLPGIYDIVNSVEEEQFKMAKEKNKEKEDKEKDKEKCESCYIPQENTDAYVYYKHILKTQRANRLNVSKKRMPSMLLYCLNNCNDLTSASISNFDGSFVATAHSNNIIKLWDIKQSQINKLNEEQNEQDTIFEDLNDSLFIDYREMRKDDTSIKQKNPVIDMNLYAKKGVTELHGNTFNVHSLSFGETNRILLSGNSNGDIYLYSTISNKNYVKYLGGHTPVWSIDASYLGFFFCSGEDDGKLRIYSTNKTYPFVTYKYICPINFCKYHYNNTLVGCGYYDNYVYLYDVRMSSFIKRYKNNYGSSQGVTTLSFSKNGRFLAFAGGHTNRINLIDLAMDKHIEVETVNKGRARNLDDTYADSLSTGSYSDDSHLSISRSDITGSNINYNSSDSFSLGSIVGKGTGSFSGRNSRSYEGSSSSNSNISRSNSSRSSTSSNHSRSSSGNSSRSSTSSNHSRSSSGNSSRSSSSSSRRSRSSDNYSNRSSSGSNSSGNENKKRKSKSIIKKNKTYCYEDQILNLDFSYDNNLLVSTSCNNIVDFYNCANVFKGSKESLEIKKQKIGSFHNKYSCVNLSKSYGINHSNLILSTFTPENVLLLFGINALVG